MTSCSPSPASAGGGAEGAIGSGDGGRPVCPGHSGYEAIVGAMASVELGWDVLAVRGQDAERYLQGQLSQDVSRLRAGGWAWSLVLQPQGRLVGLVRVYRSSGEEFLLVTDAGVGPALVERLKRFLLRTKASIEQLPWRSVSLRGPAAATGQPADVGQPAEAGAGEHAGGEVHGAQSRGQEDLGGSVCVPFSWAGLSGCDLLGESPSPPAGAVAASMAEYEAARIEAGFPRHGAELDERTIPAEAGLVEASVSFTKGCYTGQELVARIDSRGSHVPRRLRGLLLEGPAQPGAELLDAPAPDAKVVGRVTSAACSPRLGWVALAYAGRSVEPGQTLWLATGKRFVAGGVRALPLAPRAL